MSTVTQTIKRNAYAFSAGLFLLAATVPSMIVPRLASADAQALNRQITMSSSTTSAAAQTYEIKFTTATTSTVQGVVIDFCDSDPSGSPIIGSNACSIPAGMTVGTTVNSVTGLTAGTWSPSTIQTGRTLVLTNGSGASVNNNVDVTITVSGFTNPSNVRTFYARVLTFATTAGASAYTSDVPGTYVDGGGVALSTTSAIGVTATVQESLTFCVAGAAITDNCANIGSIAGPSIVLGSGDPPVLDTADEDTADVYYQLSTNAANGVMVRMKGATAGLMSGANEIPALGNTAIQFSTAAGFGMRTGVIAGDEGTLTAEVPYNGGTDEYAMYDDTDDGVNSTYGDIIAQSDGPLLNVNSPLTFAAKASATTPAGVYTGSFSLIASGSY